MKRLYLEQPTLTVRRTGLPFYDAARVIGVAQMFFGTSEATVTERGFGWQISGVSNLELPDLNRLWIVERLIRFERKPNNYVRIDNIRREATDSPALLRQKWPSYVAYFRDPFATHQLETENATSLMDAAMALGARGIDPARYGDFASESGTPSQQSEPEIFSALIGLSYAARIGNGLYLLPIFGASNANTLRSSSRLTTSIYWNFERRFVHDGGEQIASVWAMLSIIEALYDKRLPIRDFAYNRADRPIYHSGTQGAEGLCRRWRDGCDTALSEIGRFLQTTQRVRGGHISDLARALSEFALNPDSATLERVVRIKSRAMAEEDYRAMLLFRQPDTIEEVLKMVENVPSVPEGLCRAVRQALNPTKDNKGWISGYMKLETANTPHRFIEQAQRLVSRARMNQDEKKEAIEYEQESDGKELTKLIDDLASPKVFRAFRAAFLLKILQVPPGKRIELLAPKLEATKSTENSDESGDN